MATFMESKYYFEAGALLCDLRFVCRSLNHTLRQSSLSEQKDKDMKHQALTEEQIDNLIDSFTIEELETELALIFTRESVEEMFLIRNQERARAMKIREIKIYF